MPSTDISGRPTDLAVTGGDLTATLRADRGPRVASVRLDGGPNLLAELPDATIDGPHGIVHLLGGHRLWAAPEDPVRTYRPDDAPCTVGRDGGGVRATAPDDGSGLERSLSVRPGSGGLVVEGRLRAVRDIAGPVAPWMITQFPPGGVAILPLHRPGTGLVASHGLALWPYTDLSDPRVRLGRDHVEIHATGGAPLKVGVISGNGRLGYLRAGVLFVKDAPPATGGVPDLGAASQVYDGAGFLELESVGSLADLSAGDEVALVESWRALPVSGLDEALAVVTGEAS